MISVPLGLADSSNPNIAMTLWRINRRRSTTSSLRSSPRFRGSISTSLTSLRVLYRRSSGLSAASLSRVSFRPHSSQLSPSSGLGQNDPVWKRCVRDQLVGIAISSYRPDLLQIQPQPFRQLAAIDPAGVVQPLRHPLLAAPPDLHRPLPGQQQPSHAIHLSHTGPLCPLQP